MKQILFISVSLHLCWHLIVEFSNRVSWHQTAVILQGTWTIIQRAWVSRSCFDSVWLGGNQTDLGGSVLHRAVVLSRTFLQLLQKGLVVRTVYLKTGSDAERKRKWCRRPGGVTGKWWMNEICTQTPSLQLCITSPWESLAGVAPLGGTEGKVLRCPACPTSESEESWTTHCRWVNPESLHTHTETERV